MPTPFTSYAIWLGEPRRAGEADLSDELQILSRRRYAQSDHPVVTAGAPSSTYNAGLE